MAIGTGVSPFEPVVDRRIHLHEFAEPAAPGSPTPVRIAPPPAVPQAVRDQPLPQGLDADHESVVGQLLDGEGGAEVGVLLAVGGEDLGAEGGVALVIRGPTPQPVDEGGVAVGFHPALHPPHLADTLLQPSGGLDLRPLATQHAPHDGQHVPLAATHRHTIRFLYLVHQCPPGPEPSGRF